MQRLGGRTGSARGAARRRAARWLGTAGVCTAGRTSPRGCECHSWREYSEASFILYGVLRSQEQLRVAAINENVTELCALLGHPDKAQFITNSADKVRSGVPSLVAPGITSKNAIGLVV